MPWKWIAGNGGRRAARPFHDSPCMLADCELFQILRGKFELRPGGNRRRSSIWRITHVVFSFAPAKARSMVCERSAWFSFQRANARRPPRVPYNPARYGGSRSLQFAFGLSYGLCLSRITSITHLTHNRHKSVAMCTSYDHPSPYMYDNPFSRRLPVFL